MCVPDIKTSNEILISSGGDNTGDNGKFTAGHAEMMAAILQTYLPDSLTKQTALLHYLLKPASEDVLVVLHPATTNKELMACLQNLPNIKVPTPERAAVGETVTVGGRHFHFLAALTHSY